MKQKEFFTKAVLLLAQRFADKDNYHRSNAYALDAAEDLMNEIEIAWGDMTGGEDFFDPDE